jgi:integrase
LTSITRAHVKGCVDAMVAKLAPTTVRTNLGVLNAVLNAAVDADLLARSPARGIRVAARQSRERPTLTIEQLDRLAEAVPVEYRALVLVAGIVGLPWSECAGLRVGDVDFLRRTLTVRQTIAEVEGRLLVAETKSRSSRRTLSIPTFLIAELAKHLAGNRAGANPEDLVFTGPEGGPLRRYFTERVFNPAVERAGLDPGLTFHGLRHVAASLMVEQGEHPRVIQGRLGHATARLSMELYAHVPEAADRDVANHLDSRWKAITTGTDRARSGHDNLRTGTADEQKTWSERVEVMGLEPTTSTMRT